MEQLNLESVVKETLEEEGVTTVTALYYTVCNRIGYFADYRKLKELLKKLEHEGFLKTKQVNSTIIVWLTKKLELKN